MHLLMCFMILVLSFCKSVSNSNPEIAEIDKVVEEMTADEKELKTLTDEVKKSPKVYEDELNTVSNIDKMVGAGKPIDKFGEVLKEASVDLAAIREGWKARDKVEIAAAALSLVGSASTLLIPKQARKLVPKIVDKLFKMASKATLVYFKSDYYVVDQTKSKLQDYHVEELMRDVAGAKLHFTEVADNMKKNAEISSTHPEDVYQFYQEILKDIKLFGKLQKSISSYCESDETSSFCLKTIKAYIELSIGKQLILIQVLSLFFGDEINTQRKQGYESLESSLINLFLSQREADLKVLGFFFSPLESTKTRTIIFELYYKQEDHEIIINYLLSLHRENNLFKQEVYICEELELRGMCGVVPFGEKDIDIKDWKTKIQSLFIPPGFQITLIKADKGSIGPFMGLGVYSSANKLMGAESATIVKTADGEDPRNYIKICSGGDKERSVVWCDTFLKFFDTVTKVNGVPFGATSRMVIPKYTLAKINARMKNIDIQFSIFGPFIMNRPKDSTITIKSITKISTTTDGRKFIRICSTEDLTGFCYQQIPINQPLNSKLRIKSMYIPGNTEVQLLIKNGNTPQAGIQRKYGKYTGPMLLGTIPDSLSSSLVLKTDASYDKAAFSSNTREEIEDAGQNWSVSVPNRINSTLIPRNASSLVVSKILKAITDDTETKKPAVSSVAKSTIQLKKNGTRKNVVKQNGKNSALSGNTTGLRKYGVSDSDKKEVKVLRVRSNKKVKA